MIKPDRINLSIGSRCWVSCAGCYTFFGKRSASLAKFSRSMARFASLGIRDFTLSGGDPLLVDGIESFLDELRHDGVGTIKLDTVGTSLLAFSGTAAGPSLSEILPRLDVLALPLDGWSEETTAIFRRGRPHLFRETCNLLSTLDACSAGTRIYVNTVLHAGNVSGLHRIYCVLRQYGCVDHWNIFQYTSTDQAAKGANAALRITHREFHEAADGLRKYAAEDFPFEVEFASSADRLGRYLLINSDGEVWLPDESGRTVRLGIVFEREEEVLAAWSRAASTLQNVARDRRIPHGFSDVFTR